MSAVTCCSCTQADQETVAGLEAVGDLDAAVNGAPRSQQHRPDVLGRDAPGGRDGG